MPYWLVVTRLLPLVLLNVVMLGLDEARSCVNWCTKQLHLLYYRPNSQASLSAKLLQLHVVVS